MIKFEDIKVDSIIRFVGLPPKSKYYESRPPICDGLYKVKGITTSMCHTGKKQHDTTAILIKISKEHKQIGKREYWYHMNFLMEKGILE